MHDYCAWAIKEQLFGMALNNFTIFKIPRVSHFCHSLQKFITHISHVQRNFPNTQGDITVVPYRNQKLF